MGAQHVEFSTLDWKGRMKARLEQKNQDPTSLELHKISQSLMWKIVNNNLKSDISG